ncbi:polysaccharide lyase family 8 super-sandwich domain-containing protein [Aeromonas sobria]|uniref:polysaccharide lyase family 8 super-sandwich domain-containing protein n=1 Tax=Aeromonas sobria TaxID=646 RepID=UPI001396854F|nr:polysaccharide lyase family 8 super-sandwich domain-containing protein [Aeromonas sobria]
MNDENRKGWFTGDGATYIYNTDLSQYTDYWPLINPYHIAGTTVDMTTNLDDCTNKNKVASRVGKNKQLKMQRVGGGLSTAQRLRLEQISITTITASVH